MSFQTDIWRHIKERRYYTLPDHWESGVRSFWFDCSGTPRACSSPNMNLSLSYLIGTGVWPVCMSVHHVCLVHAEVRRGGWSSWNWSLDSYKTPSRCWAQNPSLLKGPLVLWTAQQALQPPQSQHKPRTQASDPARFAHCTPHFTLDTQFPQAHCVRHSIHPWGSTHQGILVCVPHNENP